MSALKEAVGLLSLSDDVICVLLRYLDATSIYLLSQTCSRLDEVIKNHITLWKHIDARRGPNNEEKIAFCVERCYSETETLLVRADAKSKMFLSQDLFQRINSFSKLSVLALENLVLDGSKCNIRSFPSQLIELSLKKTKNSNCLEFFKRSSLHFKNLKVLILDFCDWLTTYALMSISKYADLEVLSVYKCDKLDDSIAYLGLASQGFRSLKIFDARLSTLGNSLVGALYKSQSLLALYFQNHDLSYKLDYFERKLRLLQGGKRRDFLTEDEEFQTSDEEEEANCEEPRRLNDEGLLDFLSCLGDNKPRELPKNLLYLDPYGQCTCGYEDSVQKKQDLDDDDSFPSFSSKIDSLSKLVHSSGNRGFPQNPSPPSPNAANPANFIRMRHSRGVDIQVNIHLNRQSNEAPRPQNEDSPMKIYFYRGPDEAGFAFHHAANEPPRKIMRFEAGPSNAGSDSEDESPGQRPPTPHPDVNPAYRIYVLGSPGLQIINNENKDTKVCLKRLSLRGYRKITNTALRYIKDLDLELLDVTYTSVTEEGINTYLESHPLCRVVHERFCTCLPNLHF